MYITGRLRSCCLYVCILVFLPLERSAVVSLSVRSGLGCRCVVCIVELLFKFRLVDCLLCVYLFVLF